MLKEYYKEVKNIVEETTAISQTEQEEFLVGAEQYIADLEDRRYTILIAGKLMTVIAVSHQNTDLTALTERASNDPPFVNRSTDQ